jgi:hypothetical protein
MDLGYLVDDKGEAWVADPQAIRRRLQTDRSGETLIYYLVQRAGFVFCRRGRHGSLINFDRQHVNPHALVGTMRWVAEHRPDRLLFKTTSNQRTTETLLVRETALAFLQVVFDERRQRPRYQATKVALARTLFAERWEIAAEILHADIDRETQTRILGKLFNGHFTLSHRNDQTGHYIIDYAGPAFGKYNASIGSALVGKEFSDVLDTEYGRWIADHYAKITPSDGPIGESVDATIAASTISPIRMRYKRLILPYENASRNHLLVASAVG